MDNVERAGLRTEPRWKFEKEPVKEIDTIQEGQHLCRMLRSRRSPGYRDTEEEGTQEEGTQENRLDLELKRSLGDF